MSVPSISRIKIEAIYQLKLKPQSPAIAELSFPMAIVVHILDPRDVLVSVRKIFDAKKRKKN